MLIYVLSDLLWQPDYTPRIEVGLPQINMDAPRLLAHCFLYELDSYLASDPSRDFVRYMDDIDIGVDTIVEAKRALKTVDLVLQTKQIRLNSGKTVILSRSEAIRHFRVFENARIDSVQASIDYKIKNNLSLKKHKSHVEMRIKKGIKKRDFDSGNGEKILKRWINLAIKTDATISSRLIEDIVKRRPAVRQNIYSLVRSRSLTPSIATALSKVAQSGLLVDDAAMIDMANHLVETSVKTRRCHKIIESIIDSTEEKSYFGIYCRFWLLSKYGTTHQILKTVKDTKAIWSPHDRLGRLAASFIPLFHNSVDEAEFKALLSDTLNSGVREAYKFHMNLATSAEVFKAMFDTLKAQNPSRGTGITHAKFLCLMSAIKNPFATPAQIAILKNNHSLAFEDIYYKKIAKRLRI